MRKLIQLLIIVCALLLPFFVFSEDLYRHIAYSGYIGETPAGQNSNIIQTLTPIHGPHHMKFKIYYNDTDNNIQQYWVEVHEDVPVNNGEFLVHLGDGTLIDSSLSWEQIFGTKFQVYLEISVSFNGGASYTGFFPGKKITFVPYALYTDNPAGVLPDIQQNSVTTDTKITGGLEIKNDNITTGTLPVDNSDASNSDFTEWFEKEEDTYPGCIIGLNLSTGKARKYRSGDVFIGIHVKMPVTEMEQTHVPVGLLGQMDFDPDQVIIAGRIVMTKDKKKIGVLLSNGKVLIGR